MSEQRPLVSCLVVVWDGARFLRAAIDSIIGQSYRPLDVVVVDDGSTDGSDAIAASFGNQLRLIKQEHRGCAAARNTALRAARGSLIAFCDADDLWLPDKIARQVEALHSAPNAGSCRVAIENFADGEIGETTVPAGLRQPRCGLAISAVIIRREIAERAGFLDESASIRAEFAWFARISDLAGSVDIPCTLARRRLHRENRSRKNRQGVVDSAFALITARRRTIPTET